MSTTEQATTRPPYAVVANGTVDSWHHTKDDAERTAEALQEIRPDATITTGMRASYMPDCWGCVEPETYYHHRSCTRQDNNEGTSL